MATLLEILRNVKSKIVRDITLQRLAVGGGAGAVAFSHDQKVELLFWTNAAIASFVDTDKEPVALSNLAHVLHYLMKATGGFPHREYENADRALREHGVIAQDAWKTRPPKYELKVDDAILSLWHESAVSFKAHAVAQYDDLLAKCAAMPHLNGRV